MPGPDPPRTGRIAPGPIAEMPYELLCNRDVGPGPKIVYLALRLNAWAPGPHTWRDGEHPRLVLDPAYLERDTGLSGTTIRDHLKELEKAGWITTTRATVEAADEPGEPNDDPRATGMFTRSTHRPAGKYRRRQFVLLKG